jgi:uncharacterized protein (DUF2062 family)
MKPRDWRRTRLGKYLRHIPRPKHLRGTWLHRKLGDSLLDPALWHLERRKVAAGFAIGAFFSMIPMPLQMIPTTMLSYFARVNIPAAIVAVWTSNPITTPPILYLQYRLGHALLGFGKYEEIDTTQSVWEILKEAPVALLCGALVTAVLYSLLSYPVVLWLYDLLVKWIARSRARGALQRDFRNDSLKPPP